jgi:hypothetical protein
MWGKCSKEGDDLSNHALEKKKRKKEPGIAALHAPPHVSERTEDDARTRFIVSFGSLVDNIDFIHLCGKCILPREITKPREFDYGSLKITNHSQRDLQCWKSLIYRANKVAHRADDSKCFFIKLKLQSKSLVVDHNDYKTQRIVTFVVLIVQQNHSLFIEERLGFVRFANAPRATSYKFRSKSLSAPRGKCNILR